MGFRAAAGCTGAGLRQNYIVTHRRTSKVPLSAHAPLPAQAPLCFPCTSCVWSVVFPFWTVRFHRAVPLQSAVGKGEQGAELRGLGTGVKTVTPTFCPDMEDELESPKPKLYYLLN